MFETPAAAVSTRWATGASLIVAALLVLVSVAGLAADIYPTADLRRNSIPNDAVTLLIALPVLLGTLWSARRGQLAGLLFWPAALFNIVYTYLVYVIAVPHMLLFLAYLLLVTLSLYSMVAGLVHLDATTIQQRLRGAVPERVGGGVLVVLGAFFTLRVFGEAANAHTTGMALPLSEQALLIADFLLGTAWIIGGVLLWRRVALGYVLGPGLLFMGTVLFVSVIVLVLIQPLLTSAPFALADVVVLALMGLVCFVPFGLTLRGIRASYDAGTRVSV